MSLRLRLSLLFLGLFLLGVVGVLGRSIETARTEVRLEIDSIGVLTSQLLNLLLQGADKQVDADGIPDFLTQLEQLENARHFDVQILSRTRDYPQFNQDPGSALQAPAWFVSLLDFDEQQLVQAFGEFNGDTIIIRTDPTDEINEIWFEARDTLLMRSMGLLLFYLISNIAIGYWLQPVKHIVTALEEIMKGDFSRRVPRISLPELDQIARATNHLIAVLGASKADNERLTRQSLMAQEQERRYFAQELHDSLGQAVSAIKAMAVSIAQRVQQSDPTVSESALKIEKISTEAYSSVRDLMAWLRPAVLDELGLELALQHMVDEWNEHHEDTFCRLRIDGSFNDLQDQQTIHIYRIVQEGLTNAAKYSEADTVSIVLSGHEVISLIIGDNGRGFDPDRVVMGMGLSGIRDRINVLNGTLTITARPGQGTNLHMEFPRVPDYRRRANDKSSA